MSLSSFVEETGRPDRTLAVVSRRSPGPLQEMLARTFETQSIDIESRSDPDIEDDTVLLLEAETVVASVPLAELYESLLAINSDLYISDARGLDKVEFPDVLAELAEFRFELRGYPLAHKEKLLLIVVSRHIERRAWKEGLGTLRSSFQRLSRLNDEIGTREVYDRLGDSGVDVHVYGIPDRTPERLDVAVHGGHDAEYRDCWFVVFRSDRGTGDAALVALESKSRVWDAFWTYDDGRVAAIDDHIVRTL